MVLLQQKDFLELIVKRSAVRPTKRNCLFPVTVRKKIGRSLKKQFFALFFWS